MLTNAVNAELLHSGCGAPDAICVPLPDCGAEVGVLWLLLPEGRMLCNHPARHLIRILRQRVEKAEEALLGVDEMTENHVVSSGEAPRKSGPVGGVAQFYAPAASLRRRGDGDLSASSGVRL